MLTAAGTLVARSPGRCRHHVLLAGLPIPATHRPHAAQHSRASRRRRKPSAKTGATVKETNAKPQGPLIIAISIDQQKVRVYDANGLFAESPVSTGMKGHSTPMGVFSVIQKNKMHRSNIYSGAPMPFMQRITWSGVAMHAGVLPGYPASHGCIRMPMAFAVKMWNWTRMGARVIVTPGQITPANFSHPMLVAQKVAPQPLHRQRIQSDAECDPRLKSDKGADAGTRSSRNPALRFGAKPRAPIDGRSRGADARTNPHRRCRQRALGGQRRRDRCQIATPSDRHRKQAGRRRAAADTADARRGGHGSRSRSRGTEAKSDAVNVESSRQQRCAKADEAEGLSSSTEIAQKPKPANPSQPKAGASARQPPMRRAGRCRPT